MNSVLDIALKADSIGVVASNCYLLNLTALNFQWFIEKSEEEAREIFSITKTLRTNSAVTLEKVNSEYSNVLSADHGLNTRFLAKCSMHWIA